MLTAGCYARKSTDEGDKSADAKSVHRQIERAREYARAKGWRFDDRYIYSDDGVSGAEFKKRPGLTKLLAALTPQPAFDVLIVSEVSRLGRDTIRTLALIQQLQDAGMAIWSYLDDREVSVDSDLGEIEQFMKSYAASVERRKASQRTRDALRQRAEQGKPTGGRTYGFTNSTINRSEADVVRRIFRLRSQGLGYWRICRALEADNIPSPHDSKQWWIAEISYITHNERYTGTRVYGRTRQVRKGGTSHTIKSPEAPIRTELPALRVIDDKVWKKVQHINTLASARAPERSRPTASRWLLSPFISCGLCGGSMHVKRSGGGVKSGKKWYYTCTNRHLHGNKRCPNSRAVPVDWADKAITQAFEEALAGQLVLSRLEEALDGHRAADPASLHSEAKTLRAEIDRLISAFAAGKIDQVDEAVRTRKAKLERLEAQLQNGAKAFDFKTFGQKMVLPLVKTWREHLRANPQSAQVVLRKILPKRLTIAPTPGGGWRFHGMTTYTEVLKETGYEAVAAVVDEMMSKLSKRRA